MKVPPFKSAPATMAHDYTTQGGAQILAATIRQAWAAAGHDVRADVVPLQAGNQHTSWAVRMPTLVNGLPK